MSKQYKRYPDSPVNLAVINCDSADLPPIHHTVDLLQRAAKVADVILADECFNVKASEWLGEFHVAQFGKTDSSEASCVVAIRKSRGRIITAKSILGAPADQHSDVRARYWLKTKLLIDDMRPIPFSSGHAQPKRAWDLWSRYMRKAPRGVLGLDTNKMRRAIKIRFPFRKVRSINLLSAVLPRRIKAGRARGIAVGGDHKMVLVTLWPK